MSEEAVRLAGRAPLPPPPPSMRKQVSAALLGAAEDAFEALKDAIESFQSGLNEKEEVGVCLVASAGGHTFHAETIEHRAGVIVFSGVMNGKPVRLAQHHTQLNILLTVVEAIAPTPRRIGFITPSDEDLS